MKNLKKIISKNPKVDGRLLKESLIISKKIKPGGGTRGKGYNLPSPFAKRPIPSHRSSLHPVLHGEANFG